MHANQIDVSVATYNCLIGVFANNNRIEEAEAIYEEMKTNEYQANERTYCALLKAYCKNNQLDKVESLFAHYCSLQNQPGAPMYTILIEMYLSLDRESEALEILETMKNGPVTALPDSVTYSAFLGYYDDQKNDLEKMQEFFDKIMDDNEKLTALLFSRMIKAYNSRNRFDDTIKIFSLASDRNIKLTEPILNNTMHAYSMLGDVNGVMALRRYMVSKSIRFDIIGMNSLMRSWLKKKDFPQVYNVICNIDQFQLTRNEDTFALSIDLYGCDKFPLKIEAELIKMKEANIVLTDTTFSILCKHFPQDQVFDVLSRAGIELSEDQNELLLSKYNTNS